MNDQNDQNDQNQAGPYVGFEDEEEGGLWVCDECAFEDNDVDFVNCTMCNAPREKVRTGGVEESIDLWECKFCTFAENDCDFLACAMCNMPKNAGENTRCPVCLTQIELAHAPHGGVVQCPVCFISLLFSPFLFRMFALRRAASVSVRAVRPSCVSFRGFASGLKYLDSHEYLRVEGGEATVGITNHAQVRNQNENKH